MGKIKSSRTEREDDSEIEKFAVERSSEGEEPATVKFLKDLRLELPSIEMEIFVVEVFW